MYMHLHKLFHDTDNFPAFYKRAGQQDSNSFNQVLITQLSYETKPPQNPRGSQWHFSFHIKKPITSDAISRFMPFQNVISTKSFQ